MGQEPEPDNGVEKPQSDEAHSAFTPPFGVPLPPPPEDGQTTSEFARPAGVGEHAAEDHGDGHSGFRAPRGGPAAAAGVAPPPPPATGPLSRSTPWQDRMRVMLRTPMTERPTPERTLSPTEETALPVPRVLDLTLRIGELLLAGGEGAEDVEAAMFAIAHAFGLDRCEPTVTFTLLTVTYQPSLVDDPVTLSRTVRRRGTDYNRLSAVYRLVDAIVDEAAAVSLEEAYRGLAEIRRNRHPYSKWALTVASGGLSGAAATLVGGGPLVFCAAAIGAMLGDRLAWLAAGRGLPEFYQFVAAAMAPAAVGVTLNIAAVEAQSSAVITGGLFALIPGRALVAAVQDGLTGYYITASARLLEVLYLVVGIVVGVLIVLYVGVQLGAELSPDAALHRQERPIVSLLAAMLLTLAFAVLLQQERSTVIVVTLNGGVAWLIYAVIAHQANKSPVLATALAAGLVGLFGQLFSRYRFISALPYVTAAIGPLLPGSATYFGLLGFAQDNLNAGARSLLTAAALALAIAIGVNLGSEMARLFMKRPGEKTAPARRGVKRTRGF
ncbi:threonine/serine exporter family protein [Streptomyces sp. NBC_01808]|uniref:threonine/serine ThrE exporter family protein n=1 Tax=Streptomyces sp. NBC_01808 TaxID=2975947 RepID=UPI002DD91A7E|nr:threonine/serine exporter family protein [Streptomyces sp. NBC_01808]WSA38635.1 threonine/serine exporter family protein [Streptomyces sp. NBC_01808]